VRVHELFSHAVLTHGRHVAVRMGASAWSYVELENRANQFAHALLARGVSAGDVVGVNLPRSFDLIAALLGILKVGAAYLPLDRSYPQERIRGMIESARCKLIIGENLSLVEVASCTTQQVSVHEGERAYVIFTSGSTGKPKGVCMGHVALVNLLQWQDVSTPGPLVTLQYTPVSFDVHFQEIFSTLTQGGVLVLIDEEERKNPAQLLAVLQSYGVERLFLPFVALSQISDFAATQPAELPQLKHVIVAGEALRISESMRNFFATSSARLHNHYGPSETHVVTALTLSAEPSSWSALPSIGHPIAHCQVHLLDSEQRECDEGEMYLAGVCLAEGYLFDPARTAERFINHPRLGRLYRTGDWAKRDLQSQELQFLGRQDGQVKIRGHRVELGELEVVLKTLGVDSAVVAFDDAGVRELAAFVVGEHPGLRQRLAELVPSYMLPKQVIALSELPLTHSGKVDRQALVVPSGNSQRPVGLGQAVAAVTSEEKILAALFEKYLKITPVGVTDHFFELGGNSLTAVKLIAEANGVLAQKLSPLVLFQKPTIAKILNTQESKRVQNRAIVSGDIAIVAMTGRFPGAASVAELWSKICQQENLLTSFSRSELDAKVPSEIADDEAYVRVAGQMPGHKEFDYEFFGMTPREAELMDPQQRKFLELAHEGLELAGLLTRPELSIGVFAGTGNSLYSQKVADHAAKAQAFGEFNVMLGLEKDYVATRAAHKLNLKGPALSIHTGCSTSLVAVIQAVNSLRLGQCDAALAGGISISGTELRGHLAQEGGILTHDGACRPFDASASGTVFTDGGAVVVLKRLADAEAENDTILAVIKGVGLSNDGADKMSFTAPSVEGQIEALRRAQLDAKISSADIGYIEAHGTATPVGDPIEISALDAALDLSAPKSCVVSSLKGNVGHLTAAAGVAGLIKAVQVVRENLIPGSAHFKVLNPLLATSRFEFTSLNKTFAQERRIAGVSSFGVGGTNAHVILENYTAKVVQENSSVQLFKLSAPSAGQVEELQKTLMKSELTSSVAATLEQHRKAWPHRRAVVKVAGATKEFSGVAQAQKIGFVFAGQGSQLSGMGRELYQSTALFKQVVDEACEFLQPLLGYDLKLAMLNEAQDISETLYAQPAIFVFGLAYGKLLLSRGLHPDVLLGHSIGEYVAAVLAGVVSAEDGLKIVAKRAQLAQTMPRGVMLSVASDVAGLETHLADLPLDIAAINGAKNVVVAGDASIIAVLQARLAEASVGSMLLPTSHAFHSRLMVGMVPEFRAFLETIDFHPPALAMVSSVTGQLETALFQDRDYWAQQITCPVNFFASVQTLGQSAQLHVEIAAKSVLAASIKKTLREAVLLLASDASGALSELVAAAWVRGSDVRFYEDARPIVPAPTYIFKKTISWLSPGVPMQNLSSIQTDIAQIFEEASGIEVGGFSAETTFVEMGLDSLALTQIALKLKKKFNVAITFRQLMENHSTMTAVTKLLAPHAPVAPIAQIAQIAPVAPVAAATPVTPSVAMPVVAVAPAADAGTLQRVVEMQLELMQRQLEMLRGTGTATVSTPAVVAAPAPTQTSSPAPAARASVSNVKEAFGACARILVEKTAALTAEQQQHVNQFINNYCEKTRASKEFTQKNRQNHADPRVVTGFKPEWKEITYPIVVQRSVGQALWDLDGNQYVDMTCGFGSNFFGNGNQEIKKLLHAQLDAGIEIGPQHPLVGEVSQLINELTGNERSAFCNTGSEAVLGAMRIARTVTGREKIVVFTGSYHGINDEVILRAAKSGASYPAAPGINGNSVSNMIVLEYGTADSLEKIRAMASELAAVLIEPVQSRRCDFQPVEFLREIRRITEASSTCLIFDEVITGFRNHPGGAQAQFGIRADLCTYGKIVGGGMPIGVVSGKSEFMDALDGGFWQFGDDSTPTVGVTYFAGTFVRHPLALAAAKGALEIIKREGVAGLARVAKRADTFARELNLFLNLSQVPLRMDNFGGLMKPKWTGEITGGELLFTHLRYFGVHAYDGFPWFINLAHTEEDLNFVLNAFKKAVTAMQLMGVFPMTIAYQDFTASAPVPGAVLGRDLEGNPAWYVETSTGSFSRLEAQ
jgi:amino acid adenylation domain-containing protein